MIDENVFLTFDSKFKEIGKEKEKFKEDIEKYKRFSENLYLIQSIIEKTYKEIYDFLLKYLNVTEFEDIKNKINSQDISVIDKKKIFEKLLSNIKKGPGSGNKNESSNIYSLRSRAVLPPKTQEFNLSGKKNQNAKDDNINLSQGKKTILRSGAKNQNINAMSEIKEENDIHEEEIEEESSKEPIYTFVCNLVPPKNEVILYNVDLDNIIHKNIEFSKLLGTTHFLEECAWVNLNNKLYILGGSDDFNKPSQIFLEYDSLKNTIKKLPNSKYTHSRHSLFAYDNQIFVVGGDRLECEKYDINTNEWSVLPNLSFKQIYPVLYVHDNVLYSFFGIDEKFKKTDSAQKLNLKSPKSVWTKLTYKKNGCNLCLYGCGIAKINDNCILFLGGMDDTGIRRDAIQFDFSNFTANKTDFIMEEKAYFKDSVLLKLSPKSYGNFSIEETNPFLKIKFHVKIQ